MKTYSSHQYLTYRYLIALGLVAVLSITAYFSTKKLIDTHEKSGFLINLSGRQRMLSQRISLLSHLILEAKKQKKRDELHVALNENIRLMEDSHKILINEKQNTGQNYGLSRELKTIYFKPPINLDKETRDFIKKTKIFLDTPPQKLSNDNKDLKYLFDVTSSKFLISLNTAVDQLQRDSETRIAQLHKMEKLILALTLFTLLVVALSIFHPMVRRIEFETLELFDSQKRLLAVLNTVGEGIITIDKSGNILTVNQEAQNIWNYSQEEIVSMKAEQLLPVLLNAYQQYGNNNLIGADLLGKRTECEGVKKNGMKFPLEISINETKIEDDIFFTAAVRDITIRKQAEEQLKCYAEELRLNSEDSKSFAYIISHDLRSPLVNLKGFSGELSVSLKEIDSIVSSIMPKMSEEERNSLTTLIKEDVPEALGFIQSSVNRMDNLINAILRLARMGRKELTPEPIDMEELTHAILKSMAHQIEKRHVKITGGQLPNVFADRISVEQIMGNILTNAVYYLESGRPAEISITSHANPKEVTFNIRDNGRGIAEEDIPKVFEIFQRIGKQNMPGEGMGLTYVQTLIRKHGGKIWCESKLGEGTLFSFTLPALPDEKLT